MSVRIGFLGVAHMHSWGYAHGMRKHASAVGVGVWDPDKERREEFGNRNDLEAYDSAERLLNDVDAVIITSDNKSHAELGAKAAQHGKHVLCEKPLVTSEAESALMLGEAAKAGIKLMTAFPCRYSPAFMNLVQKVRAGEIGKVRAICATNRGSCPFGWFVEKEKSGGGAMIDHVVHVADLLWVLLQEAPTQVQAQIGNNMYSQDWEDTAMLSLTYPSGIVATLDSSWSRPKSYRTWGDVTMNVVGEGGVLELDMFGRSVESYSNDSMRHVSYGFGSDLDRGLVGDFLRCIEEDTEPPISGEDGWRAARVALAGYRSVEQGDAVAF